MAALEEEYLDSANDATIPTVIEQFQSIGYEDADDEEVADFFAGVAQNPDWAPYASKTMCYLDILDNLPRLRLSSSQLKIFLWIMRVCGAKDVPSFKALRQAQKQIRDNCSVRVTPSKSDFGNLFYTTNICDIVAQDMANPEVAPMIHVYPEDVHGSPISEMWQVPNGRWLELPLDFLTPSILINNKRHYIHEVAQLQDLRWIIPKKWVVQAGKIYADAHLVRRNSQALLTVDMNIIRVPIPNCNRTIDNNEDLFTIWLSVWMDDVSGARSKQYQKHVNAYAQIANLPGKFLQQESTHVEPIRCFNASTKRPCSVRIVMPDGPADNPQQAELSSHIGGGGNCKCRSCLAGDDDGFHATEANYHQFYECGKPRNVQDIRNCVLEQIRLATYGVASHVEKLQTKTGTKDKIAQHWIEILLKESSKQHREHPETTKDEISEAMLTWLASQTNQPYNPLLDVDFFDPSQDTLVEILHTILLGTEKYVWHDLHTSWNAELQDTFTIRLQSTNTDGLLVPPIRARYMMQYRNGLIGKHFKTLMQTMIFHAGGLVTPEQMTLLRTTGELGAVLWISEIDNMDNYLADLEVLIGNVLDAFAAIDPSKILIKVKLHTIVHVPSHIRRRGPGSRFSTEVFECFNGIFPPSRDIALKFSDLERVKHLVSGGYWCDSHGKWVQAGNEVRALLRQTPIFQKHLGWTPKAEWVPGLVKQVSRAKKIIKSISDTHILSAHNPTDIDILAESEWVDGIYATAVSGDQCKIGSFAILRYKNGTTDMLSCIGRIKDILTHEKDIQGVLVVEEFDILEALHPIYFMPIIRPSGRLLLLHSEALQFVVNVQHDCRGSNCQPTGKVIQRQERQDSGVSMKSIEHNDDRHFIINMHALHNAHLLRRFLPRYLTVPRPLHSDRKKWHGELAKTLVVTQAEKRAETNRKAAETRAKNAATKNAAAVAKNTETAGTETGDQAGAKRKRI
ncbi:hypothetical protein C8R41DRAFT_872068 [Lentinula lateritia]|uniref:Uncharacterized protein n=1 Tax=Lentinula lateritia TaxID=40482 RepID=A0ABQ8UXA0_9AGAR|nr:hypothetical protein C8R41DRAFT_872068 [Lentinula lateritia]